MSRRSSRRLPRIELLLIAVASLGYSQTGVSRRPEFAVVSIKPSLATCCSGSGIGRGGSHGKYVTLHQLIELAYRVPPFQVSGGPNWISSDRFDIECKADDPKTDNSQLRLMLQSMLEDRFTLKLHREMKDSPVYALVVSKNGPKIKVSSDQNSPDDVGPPSQGDAGPNHGAFLLGNGVVIGNAVQLSQLATVISPQLERTVVDKTNLTGRFDIQLRWTPVVRELQHEDNGKPPLPASSDLTSIFTAFQEQLGLRLESTKSPVEVIVIDRAQRPSEN